MTHRTIGRDRIRRWRSRLLGALAFALILARACLPAHADEQADQRTAALLAEMLRSVRQVIAQHQAQINDPAVGDKGLTGEVILAETVKAFRDKSGVDPGALDPASRDGRLVGALEASIREVVDEQQETINAKGVGFKAFIPAVVGRLVGQKFNEKEGAEALIRITAPLELVRNRTARPDRWETSVIESTFKSPGWKAGQPFSAAADAGGREAFRVLVPEYYGAGCLSCHGAPKGEVDITGYPKEGASLGQLGGVISITLFR